MHKIGTTELILILAIALLILGPTVLPKLGKSMGRTIASFKKGVEELDDCDDEEEVAEKKAKKTQSAKKTKIVEEIEDDDGEDDDEEEVVIVKKKKVKETETE
ncbi:MAG TPA: twin-arginine translocase TatA/TatE family subunit [Clostridiales bacterium]|jgi:TatA/E family protein of Tat protein translocase|nr:twin-arginine translocase TatA/TatE family subunit [Clostridiales bacterium]HBR08297.1 twin-arginine translocase TatA/TatE family subunit [Clostridiales bacterium]